MDKPKRLESVYHASSPPPQPRVTFEAPPPVQTLPASTGAFPYLTGGYAPCNYKPVLLNYTDLGSESIDDPETDQNFDLRWNNALKRIHTNTNPLTKYKELSSLAKDFVYTAQLYAKIIISEIYTAPERRTVKPVTLGGIAGGEKYICQGILYKFALDLRNMYGGDQNAMKVAGHELKGLMCYYNCQIPEILLPLMALIDYRGFRVVAISMLPVGKETIIYGSHNAGKDVHAADKTFNALMKVAGTFLNLKEHYVGTTKPVRLYGPADIEGHKSKEDGCYYLLDFARTMPPQAPNTKSQAKGYTHLFELLRPELVKKSPAALSSDAFCGFGNSDQQAEQHNLEVTNVCTQLFNTIIPQFFSEDQNNSASAPPVEPEIRLRWSKKKDDMNANEFVQRLHLAGINLRHIGLVRESSKIPMIKNLALHEMVSRILKDQINLQSRAAMQTNKIPNDEVYRQLILGFFNNIFVFDRDTFWGHTVKQLIAKKYKFGLTKEEIAKGFNLLTLINVGQLMKRFGEITNINIDPTASSVLEIGASEIVDSDLLELNVKVKKMNLITEATAMVLAHEATERHGTEATRLFQEAIRKFNEAISASPNSKFAYSEFGKMLHSIASKSTYDDDAIVLLTEAIQKLEQAVAFDENFVDGKIDLVDAMLDFVTHRKRLWLIYRRDEKAHFEGLTNNLTKIGTLLKGTLRAHMSVSEDTKKVLNVSMRKKVAVKKVQKIIEDASDIKLFALFQASLACKPLQTIFKQRETNLEMKKSLVITKPGCVIFDPQTYDLIPKFLPNLETLTLHYASKLTATSLASILTSLPNLKVLELSGADRIPVFPTALCLNLRHLHLAGMPEPQFQECNQTFSSMQSLSFSGSNISNQQLEDFTSKMPSLKTLSLGKFINPLGNTISCASLTGPSIKCKDLDTLDFFGCLALVDAALIFIAKQCTQVTSINLSGCHNISDDSVIPFAKKMKNCLKTISLSSTKITDSTIKALSTIKTITLVDIELCRAVKGTTMKLLFSQKNSLETLRIGYLNPEILDLKAFKALTQHPTLSSIDVTSWNLMDSDVESIVNACPNLTGINLTGCFQVSDKALIYLGEKLGKKLRNLTLNRCLVISSAGFIPLSKTCSNLETVEIDFCSEITNTTIHALAENCTELKTLSLLNVNKIKTQDLQYLLHRLTSLTLLKVSAGQDITPQQLAQVRHRCPKLIVVLDGAAGLMPAYEL